MEKFGVYSKAIELLEFFMMESLSDNDDEMFYSIAESILILKTHVGVNKDVMRYN